MTDAVNARLRAYARLLVRAGVNLAEGQELLVHAQLEHAPFVRAIAEEAYAAGARYVDVAYADRWVQRAFVEAAPDDMLGWTPPWMVARLERAIEVGAAVIGVSADSGAEVFEGLDGDRLARARFRDFDRMWMDGVMGRKLAWSLVAYPTEGWAREALGEPDVDRLWDAFAHALRLDEPDPADAWRTRLDELRGAGARPHRARLRRAALPRPRDRPRGRPDRGRALDGRPRAHRPRPGPRAEPADRGGLHEPAPRARRGHHPQHDAARPARDARRGPRAARRGRGDRRGTRHAAARTP